MSRAKLLGGAAAIVLLAFAGAWLAVTVSRGGAAPARQAAAPAPAAVSAREPPATRPVRAPAAAPRQGARAAASGAASEALARDLADPDPRARGAALRTIEQAPAAEWVDEVEGAMRDSNPSVSATAADVLGRLYQEHLVEPRRMVEHYRDGALPFRTRSALLSGFGQQPTDEAAQLLLELARSTDERERRAAAILLANQEPRVAVPALIEALGDRDEWVRANARESLTRLARGRDYGEDVAAWRAWWERERR